MSGSKTVNEIFAEEVRQSCPCQKRAIQKEKS